MNYKPTIGMEVHVELATKTKMFCGCPVDFGGDPNTRCCPICTGLPGALPVVNKTAIEYMLKAALALNCKITYENHFYRKNYYYPDLPKGFQNSQYDNPLGYNGYLEIKSGDKIKKIAIARVHMEEDTGKLIHIEDGKSLVDYNRSSTSLMEIVTQVPAPDGYDIIESAEEAREYVKTLRQLLVYLHISDCKMEEGSMRCEPNISVRPENSEKLGTKTELKNLNSFRVVYLSSDYEIKRQIRDIEDGIRIVQETRRWDEANQQTLSMRSKESAEEYRYFPEPDLVPVILSPEYVEDVRKTIPELPVEKALRFVNEYGISGVDADILVEDPYLAEFFDNAAKKYSNPKTVSNWILTEMLKLINNGEISVKDIKITSDNLVSLLAYMEEGKINRNTAKTVFAEMFETGKSAGDIIKEKGLEQVSDTSAIEETVEKILSANPKEVERYQGGEVKLMGFFTGQIMKEMKGKGNPAVVSQILKEKLGEPEA